MASSPEIARLGEMCRPICMGAMLWGRDTNLNQLMKLGEHARVGGRTGD